MQRLPEMMIYLSSRILHSLSEIASRFESVEVLHGHWENEQWHERLSMDVFQISSKRQILVKLLRSEVEVIEPEEFRQFLREKAKNFINDNS